VISENPTAFSAATCACLFKRSSVALCSLVIVTCLLNH
jgi:hypothetical protein